MNIAIDKIRVTERIRKLASGVDELAKDIQKNGLINPITVMATNTGNRYQLLAGLRRLRAAQSLGWTQIEVTVVPPKDAEAALNIEYSENVQREAFTFSEKMDYARLIAEIEKAKAKERMSLGGQGRLHGDYLNETAAGNFTTGSTNAIVGPKVGMSRTTYARAKFVADNAPPEAIEQLDNGERTIRGTYDELRSRKKLQTNTASAAPLAPKPDLESDLERAIRAESELDAFKYRQHNEIYHRDSIIENLKIRIAELEAALDAANARIQELEGGIPCKSGSLNSPID